MKKRVCDIGSSLHARSLGLCFVALALIAVFLPGSPHRSPHAATAPGPLYVPFSNTDGPRLLRPILDCMRVDAVKPETQTAQARTARPLSPPPGLNMEYVRQLANECPSVTTTQLRDILGITWRVCREEGYHFLRAVAQMRAESDFNPRLVSSAGAVGLMQILSETAKDMGFDTVTSVEDNIRCGVRYMVFLDRFAVHHTSARERWLATLACYNSGPSHYVDILERTIRRTGKTDWMNVARTYRRRFRRARGQRLPETLIFVRRNLDMLKQLHENLFVTYPGPVGSLDTLVRHPLHQTPPVISAMRTD